MSTPQMPEPAGSQPEGSHSAHTHRTDSASAADPSTSTRLRGWAGWRPTRAKLLVALLALVLGFGISTQLRQTREQGLESLSQAELVGILDTVTQRNRRLDEEVAALTRTRDELLSQSGSQAALAAAAQRVEALEILTGAVPVAGPGVSVTMTDPHGQLTATTLLDAVQELRDAGAEAIQVGPVRVVASSYFTESAEGKLQADGVDLQSPYTVVAVGDGATLAGAMAIPGGVVDSVRQRGATITVVPAASVTITALHRAEPPRYAQPQSGSTGGGR